MFTLVALYHTFIIPKPAADKSTLEGKEASVGAIFAEFGRTFKTYFMKPGVVLAIVFMLLYRLPEAFLIKLCMPFLVAKQELGGLGMSTASVGIAYGTIGVLFLTIGGILGGIYASRVGLKKSLWVMAACMTLPCITFVYLAICQPTNLALISTAIAIEQFGYGFGETDAGCGNGVKVIGNVFFKHFDLQVYLFLTGTGHLKPDPGGFSEIHFKGLAVGYLIFVQQVEYKISTGCCIFMHSVEYFLHIRQGRNVVDRVAGTGDQIKFPVRAIGRHVRHIEGSVGAVFPGNADHAGGKIHTIGGNALLAQNTA